jgi:formate/nitrite transporter FocA (FNT family)
MRRTRAWASGIFIAAGVVLLVAPRDDARPNSWTVHLLLVSVLWGVGLVGLATSRPVAPEWDSGGEEPADE